MFGRPTPEEQITDPEKKNRVYCVCLFKPGAVVPVVKLIDAACDEQAVAVGRSMNPASEWEVWDHHRLVAQCALVTPGT